MVERARGNLRGCWSSKEFKTMGEFEGGAPSKRHYQDSCGVDTGTNQVCGTGDNCPRFSCAGTGKH
jgi:hypothetical protein